VKSGASVGADNGANAQKARIDEIFGLYNHNPLVIDSNVCST
jgi:hypothetical protein